MCANHKVADHPNPSDSPKNISRGDAGLDDSNGCGKVATPENETLRARPLFALSRTRLYQATIPAATVLFVASSITMKLPVEWFLP